MEENAKAGKEALEQLLGEARTKQVPAGQILAYEDDIPHEVFIIKRGVVEIYDIDDQGNEKILHLVKPPALVPFAFFSAFRRPLRWYYSTLTDCELCVLEYAELKAMTRSNGALAEVLTNGFSEDVHELLVRLSSLGKTNSQGKVAAALAFLATRHASTTRSGWRQVDFPVSHQLIANLYGITRESAALAMKDLQTRGAVRYPKPNLLEIRPERLNGG